MMSTVKWSDARYGYERATVGPFTLTVGWGSRNDQFIAEISPLDIRSKGLADMDAAKAKAEAMLRHALMKALGELEPKESP